MKVNTDPRYAEYTAIQNFKIDRPQKQSTEKKINSARPIEIEFNSPELSRFLTEEEQSLLQELFPAEESHWGIAAYRENQSASAKLGRKIDIKS